MEVTEMKEVTERNKGRKALIRFVGAPVTEVKIPKDPELTPKANEDQVETVVKLEGSDGTTLDAFNDESFTLETFDTLIQTAKHHEKSFLVGRVTTVDPRDPTRLYFSFYSAHQLNKTLFRTEPTENLLHRMKTRNPLNNMLIIGDVHYFMVTPESVEKSFRRFAMRNVVKTNAAAAVKLCRSLSESHKNNRKLTTLKHSNYSSDRIRDDINLENEEPVLQYEAVYIGTDDDYMIDSKIREIFKKNAIQRQDYQLYTLDRDNIGTSPFYHLGSQGNQIPDDPPTTILGIFNRRSRPSHVFKCTGFIKRTPFAIFATMCLLAGVILCIFLFPIEYLYFGGPGLLAFFIIIFLLFVERSPRLETSSL